ncbi:MAG: hypothetical protein M3N08_01980 [Pseudomonadota bacterium]|nr:hypothetical protein [Pseudomonadota bacterium]
MTDQAEKHHRREFLAKSLAMTACIISAKLLPAAPFGIADGGVDARLLQKTIPDAAHAILLLEAKIDRALFQQPDLMKDIRRRFNVPSYYLDGLIHFAANKQIKNTVHEFKEKNRWDTQKTLYEPMTPESVMRRYKGRLSRLFHEKIAPRYVEFMKLPAGEQNRSFQEKFGEIEKLLGCGIEQQLGYKTVADGCVKINSGWDRVPLYQRPPVNFDRIVETLGIQSSPFAITIADLKMAGISPDDGPQRPSKFAHMNERQFSSAVR